MDAWIVGAIFAVAGTLDALIAGADLSDAFLSGIISGVSAGALAKVGSVLGEKYINAARTGLTGAGRAIKIFAHGTIGGVTSVLQGGKFGHGFASSALSAGASGFAGSGDNSKFSWNKVVVNSAIGGSISRLTGGKFANGARSGAFASIASQWVQTGGLRKFRTWLSKKVWPSHYARNQVNDANLKRKGFWGARGLTDIELEDAGFKRSGYTNKVFHDRGAGNSGNQRWSYKVADFAGDPYVGTEIVIDAAGNHVMNQPFNAESFNYAVTGSLRGNVAHFFKDMLPYFFFGNSSADPTNLGERFWRNIEKPRRAIFETPAAYGQ